MAEIFSDLAAEIVAELDHEFERNLIESVKWHRCLYATDHKDYENMQQNKIAWLKISSSLNKSVPECMNKWYALLQTFLHYFKLESNNVTNFAPTIVWPHYKSIKEMQPYLAENYSELLQLKPPFLYGKPSVAQKEALFAELETNRVLLLSTNTAIELRQQTWSQIADKLNAIEPGARMPVIKWQKYWWDLKQNVGVQRSWIQTKLKAMGTHIEMSKFSEEDVRILKFCGATPADTPSCISLHLSSNLEFGSNTDQIIRKCKKCTIVLNDLTANDYCDTCRKIPRTLCDICSKRHEDHLLVYQLKNWSTHAKNLLPSSFYTYAELSMCSVCSSNLKKQASIAWKACRICESYNQILENLFAPSNDNLRQVFKEVTNIEFSEGDGLPVYFCKICKIQMQQFNNFYLRFCRAQTRLREIHVEKFVGVASGRPPGKKKPLNSITSANQVMILKPDGGNSTADTGGIQQDYTLQPRPVPEMPTANIAATIKPSISRQSPTQMQPRLEHAYSKRICPTQAGLRKTISIRPGTIIAKQIGNTVPAKPTKVNVKVQPAVSPLLKGICALPTGTTSATSINANIPPTVAKRICSTAVTPVLNTNSNLRLHPVQTNVKATQGIQPGTIPVTTNVGPTITNRTLTNTTAIPTKGTGPMNTEMAKRSSLYPLEPARMNTVVRKENSSLPPGSIPISSMAVNPGINVSKRIHASQPAVFTITGVDLDYEEQLDSPPIFCIPKSTSAMKIANNQSSEFVKHNTTTSPTTDSTTSTTIHPTIKTEKIDDGYPGEQLQTASLIQPGHHGTHHNNTPSTLQVKGDSEISSNDSTVSVDSTNLPSAPNTPKRMKLVRLDGSTVVFNPNLSTSVKETPNVQNKNSSFQNEFTSGKFHVIQPRKVFKERLGPSNTLKIFSGRKSQTYPLLTEEQHRQQQSSAGNKRPRKYWGAVDEFQITPVSPKNLNNPSPMKQRRMTIHNLSPWSGDSPITASTSPTTTSLPSGEIPTNVVVKVEKDQPLTSDLNPSMFYPDSFELGNFSLDSDVSSMISKMMTNKEPIDENIKSFEYLNPSFLVSYCLDQDQSNKMKDESNEEEINEKDPKKEESKERQPGAEKRENNDNVKHDVKIPIKKLRIKLRRNKGLRKLASRLKNKVPQSPPLITRKSLRQSLASRNDKFIT